MGASGNSRDYLYSLASSNEYEEIIKYIRNHQNEHVRYGAAGVLSESISSFKRHMSPHFLKALVDSVLNDPSDMVRASVLRVLLDIDENTIDNVITRFEMNPNSTPSEEPYPLILTGWHNSNHAELRYLAVVGFGRTGNQSAMNRLRTTVKKEQTIEVLERAIHECGENGAEKSVSPIQEHLRADPSEYQSTATTKQIDQIKHAAVEALVKIGTDAAYEALITASRSTDEELREQVISEIGKFGAQDTIDVILDELNTDSDEDLREEAAEGVITTFRETDFDKGDSIRQQTIEEIGNDISAEVSHEFASIIDESPRDSERRNAAWLLGQLEATNEKTINSLLDSLQSDDDYLRKIATASLTNLDESEVSEHINTFKQDIPEGSKEYRLASFIESNIEDEAEKAKKELVDYSYVESPNDYSSDNRSE